MGFYPRHPCGWRPPAFCYRKRLLRVSIHATLAGGDATALLRLETQRSFYPRHPRGWRRPGTRSRTTFGLVSIHATLAGGDCLVSGPWCSFRAFLSTPPSRVATPGRQDARRRLRCFYPRHPRGWRRIFPLFKAQRQRVSIHATLAGGDWLKDNDLTLPEVSIHATLAGGDRARRCPFRSG